jgi:hypothetical protein
MRPDEGEGLTGVLKPNLVHEIRCPIRPERPGGYRNTLQQSDLESQLFIGFDKLPCSFRNPPIKFTCNSFLLIQAQCLLQPEGGAVKTAFAADENLKARFICRSSSILSRAWH